MLSYIGTRNAIARVYSYRHCIYEMPCSDEETAALVAERVYHGLNFGFKETAIICAQWCVDNRNLEGKLHISLGPYYYLKVDDLTVRDNAGQIVKNLSEGL